MTIVYMHPVLAACLTKAEQRIGNTSWQATNEEQQELVDDQAQLRALVDSLPSGMLESMGSTSAEEINKFLHGRGMTGITMPPFGPDEFGTAAVLDVLTMWKHPGSVSKVYVGSEAKNYPAVNMLQGFTVRGDAVVQIETTDPQVEVYLAPARSLGAGLSLIRRDIDMPQSASKYAALCFPMVDYDGMVDVGWLIGLSAVVHEGEAPARLTNALAQAKLRINEKGAHAKAAAAIAVSRGAGPPTFKIDEPFVIAFVVKDQVALAFHVTIEDWKAPPNLGTKDDSAKGEVW
jgi:hypothetical protein